MLRVIAVSNDSIIISHSDINYKFSSHFSQFYRVLHTLYLNVNNEHEVTRYFCLNNW